MNTNQAVRSDCYRRGQLWTRYEGNTETVVNLATSEMLRITLGEWHLELPPNGYAAIGSDFFELSGLWNGKRVDLVFSPKYVYVDGRGAPLETDKIALKNSAVILREAGKIWLIPIDEHEKISVRLNAFGLDENVKVVGCDQDSQLIPSRVDYEISHDWLTITCDENFFKYKILKQ